MLKLIIKVPHIKLDLSCLLRQTPSEAGLIYQIFFIIFKRYKLFHYSNSGIFFN